MITSLGPKRDRLIPREYTTSQENLSEFIIASGLKDATQTSSFVQIDSQMGFKIELKFSKNLMIAKGTLQYLNGRPIYIPNIYRDLLLERTKNRIGDVMSFRFSNDSETLYFESKVKLDSLSSDPVSLASSHLKTVLEKLPQIYSYFVLLGVGKNRSFFSLNLLTKRLKLLRNVCQTIHRKEESICQFVNKFNVSSLFKRCHEIIEIQNSAATDKSLETFTTRDQLWSIKYGGYFEVHRKQCHVIVDKQYYNNTETNPILTLAVKKLKKSQKENSSCMNKIQREILILKEIKDPEFCLDYWVIEDCPANQKSQEVQCSFLLKNDKMYIQYVDDTLDDYIFENRMRFDDIIDISSQIIKAVGILSESGIIHRDIKPDNILLSSDTKEDGSTKRKIKIIDFAESTLTRESFSDFLEESLGSTMPYSPIECYFSDVKGFNNPSIDVWSVGLILYELMFGSNPVSYSRCFATDIYRGWNIPEEFSLFPMVMKRRGCRIIEIVFSILAANSVRIDQSERLSLQKMGVILQHIQQFISEIEKQLI